MDLVIDAQVLCAFFKENVLCIPGGLTAEVSGIFQEVGRRYFLFLDNKGNIEYEWRQLVEQEWFNAWYGNMLIAGHIQLIPAKPQPALEKRLMQIGFPKKGRDKWYVRTCKTVAHNNGQSHLLTEDLDFYHPREKANRNRLRRLAILEHLRGPVLRELKRVNIHVRSACRLEDP